MTDKPSYLRQFGIVQGRLTIAPRGHLQWFPQDSWQKEFLTAEKVGIHFIELLTERQYNKDNPFWSDSGRAEIKAVNNKSGRTLYSSCIDYIIDHSIIDDADCKTRNHVMNFLEASADLGCKVVVFPLLEQSDLNILSAELLIPRLKEFARQAAKLSLLICIESLMEASYLKAFLERVCEPNVKCVFDTGNRAVSSIDLTEEIYLLNDWIAHVHIKDKTDLGENVLLGTGRVNFAEVFRALRGIAYEGPLVFETTRGIDPIETAIFHMATCNFFSHEAHYG